MNNSEKIQQLIRMNQPFSSMEAQKLGISRMALTRMCHNGLIERVAHGIYVATASLPSNFEDMKVAAKFVPYGIFCLFSALKFHNLTTQLPHDIWMAVPQGSRHKELDHPAINYISLSSGSYNFGIEEHEVDGMKLKVYSVAKTVADCFKFRNKIGLEVAIEALKDAKVSRKATNAEIFKAAKACRVKKIIMPYMEAMT